LAEFFLIWMWALNGSWRWRPKKKEGGMTKDNTEM
jgi:hypothetical protein